MPLLGSLGGEWGERHAIAELLQALNVVALAAFDVALLEVGGAEFVVWALVAQQAIRDDEQTVRNRHGRLVLAAASSQPLVLGRQKRSVCASDAPGGLAEHGPQPDVAFGRSAAKAFATAVLVARADASPRRQVLCGWKATHVGADLGDQRRCHESANARNGL